MIRKMKQNKKGEAILVTTILLLIMIVIVEGAATTASIQLNLGYMQRNNSNTYYLAKSGVEKGVDVINQGIQAQMPIIIEDFRKTYISPLTDSTRVRTQASVGGTAHSFLAFYECDLASCTIPEHKYSKIRYENGTITVDPEVLSGYIKQRIYQYVEDEYIKETEESKPITYDYFIDGDTDTSQTQVVLHFKEDTSSSSPAFVIQSTAERLDGSSSHTVEGHITIDVPKKVTNVLVEKYEWLNNPPEILDSAITVFSDVVVTKDAQLTVIGDIRAKGSGAQTNASTKGNQTVLSVPDTEEFGGVVASNGGAITVKSGLSITNSSNTGSIYSLSNVFTTHGWQPNGAYTNTLLDNYTKANKSYIKVEQGDIIANTVSIVDDFYADGYNKNPADEDRTVQGNSIIVGGNVFVDNDVRIDAYVKDSLIQVKGSIFGVSDGTLGKIYDLRLDNGTGGLVNVQAKDPNQSSGVMNRGQGSSLIEADGIFVNGQPYIDLGKGIPAALLESIGEPFQDVNAFPGYNETPPDAAGNDAYLDPSTNYLYDFIKLDRVKIADSNKIYTPDTYVSAIVSGNAPSINKYANSKLSNKVTALNFFYRGGSAVNIKSLTGNSKYDAYNALMFNTDYYYTANATFSNLPGMYNKQFISNLGEVVTSKYQGLRGLMTAKRSVFYTSFDKGNDTLLDAQFGDLVDVAKVKANGKWSVSNPIKVVSGGEINIDEFYASVDGGFTQPYPTIIVNTGGALTIKGGIGKAFKGVIISKDKVTLEGRFSIEGSLIIGGPANSERESITLGKNVGLLLSGSDTHVTITHNPNVILETTFSDPTAFRSVLDALKITQFTTSSNTANTNLATVFGPYVSSTLNYTQGRVKLSEQSILKLDTKQINVGIDHIKKINE